MLTELKIENVAVIEKARVGFGAGLNVLTGETGAGKSILIDAVGAVLGERTSKELVREGADTAKVSAFFESISEEAQAVLAEFDLEPEADGSLLIARTIAADGRNTCRVNGQNVTVSMLRKLGRELITICGQHDSQHLLQKERHLSYIDVLADCGEQKETYAAAFEKLKEAKKELQLLSKAEQDKQSRLDFLAYQISELEQADIKPGERETLQNQKRKIQNREKIARALQTAASCIDSDEGGLLGGLYQLGGVLSSLEDPSFSAFSEKAESFRYELEDCLSAVYDGLRELEDDETDINEIEARLDLLYRLSRKYGDTEEEMLSQLETLRQEYDAIAFASERKAKLEAQVKQLEETVFQTGCFLSDCRKAAALRFEEQVTAQLAYLDMPGAEFTVRFLEQQPAPNGLDDVEFLISANPGQAPKPLIKIASGGELSRVMLAIRCVLSDAETQTTMIFDEIDSGVSGRAANKIAAKLRQVSCGRQVICVTHLAQIAAAADSHFLIEKTLDNANTYTNVYPLDGAAREEEIARIIGGSVITDATRSSARELIEFASQNDFFA